MNKTGITITELANEIVSEVSENWYYGGSPIVRRPDTMISLRDIVLRILIKNFVEDK